MNTQELFDIISPILRTTDYEFFDEEYLVPSRSWVEDTFSKSFKLDLSLLGMSQYLEGQNDCDEFALLAYALLRVCHRKTQSWTSKQAVAFGLLRVVDLATGGGHITCFFPSVEDKQVYVFEPQTQQVKLFSEEEYSVLWWKM